MSCGCGYGGWFSPPDPNCPEHGLRAEGQRMIAAADAADRKARAVHCRKIGEALQIACAHLGNKIPRNASLAAQDEARELLAEALRLETT